MAGFDETLAAQIDALAPIVTHRLDDIAGAGNTVSAAADRLRAIGQMPPETLPPPPIAPTKLPPMPAGHFEHTLEKVDGLEDGFHDVGRMPRRNAKLDKPSRDGAPSHRIFTDPRLREKHK